MSEFDLIHDNNRAHKTKTVRADARIRACIKLIRQEQPESFKARKYRRALVNWEIQQHDITKLHETGYAPVEPQFEQYKPGCDSFRLGETNNAR